MSGRISVIVERMLQVSRCYYGFPNLSCILLLSGQGTLRKLNLVLNESPGRWLAIRHATLD